MQYRNVIDRQTDRQTDRHHVMATCALCTHHMTKRKRATNDLEVDARVHWQWEREECKRVKLDTCVLTLNTANARLELSMKQINDN